MGGGLAMRAAAKAAGIGVLNGVRSGENPVASAARNATRSVSASVSSNNNCDDLKLITNRNDVNNNSVEKVGSCYDDDWEFAGEDELLFMEPNEPVSRLVFGAAPSMFEAKQATSDLNDALKNTYLSPNVVNGQKSDLEHVTTPSLVSETLVTPFASKNAMQAFRLLNENPKAQTVVASIACDPNVWHAVMQNPDLVDFLQSHKTDVVFPEMDSNVNDDDSSVESPKASESQSVSGKSLMDYVEDIKQKITVTVIDMMNSLSDTFQSFFGGSPKGGFTANPDGSASLPIDKTIGASLMGLAIMVITVIVLKRPAA